MRYGMRKPSIKKSISARTKGRATRTIKRSVNPMYGKKGMGWVNNPSKAAYNKVYNKTTFSVRELPNGKKYYTNGSEMYSENEYNSINRCSSTYKAEKTVIGCAGCLVALPFIPIFLFFGWVMLYSFINILLCF